ncbi:angiotensin-converting enzyme-like protein Ace3 [Talpa occidentalis]|uniref:angiotensin-converting enzyme-like protein Ace3 n=1 Tax=Talpa occidentalis TaxID=50954 RepID=UPI00188E45A4|nr:angiotensin-converting enzyme-like protein Ace3 [Talpa occidentalis]XP_037350442.1 angiotensin-converting enzyme-like protein Ace3 [Talpa occidentalis]
MGTRWTCHGPSLLVLFCYGQLLPWLRTEGDDLFGTVKNEVRQEDQQVTNHVPNNAVTGPNPDTIYNETMATSFLEFYEVTAQMVWNELMEATWNYVTNITKKNREEMLLKDVKRSQHMLYFGSRARLFRMANIQSPTVKRMLSKLQHIDKAALPQDDLREYNQLLAYMETTYSMAQVCLNEGPCLSLEPDLQEIMATSQDERELVWAWQGWRDAVGRPLRFIFEHYVQLSNKIANLNGYKDMGAMWRAKYESDTLEWELEQLYQELRPLYLNLHAYVRRALHRHYGPHMIDLRGPIPAHLLGNMWAQSWVNILDLVLPFPNKPLEDITKIMKVQHWRPAKMFEEADKFFISMGLLPTPPEFWKRSMLERPTDGREVECHASAWDFFNGKDFRIKKCTEVTIEDLLSVFHQMGHIQYFMQYRNLSVIFRAGANPAFEEAMGSVITLSVSTHKHMLNKGLLSQQHQDPEEEVNFLMGIALEKIPFIPFAYLMDLFRWKVFDGSIHKGIYNQEWWNLRLKYQGLCPPVPRSEDDFDPGAKFHISASVPYLRYFLGLVLQFQIHEALCMASGHMGPLHRCDIYNSKIAGKLMEDVLKLGSSKPWPEVLQQMTGQTKMSAKALMRYFKPLMNWLVAENVREGEILGWPDFSCSFEEKVTDKAAFLGLELDNDQANTGQWVLLVVSFVLFLVALVLACRLYSREKQSLTQNTSAPDSEDTSAPQTVPKAYFLGVAMDPRQVTRRQWILLCVCLIMVLCSIALVIRMFTQHNRKPPWMRAQWWSWA